MAMPAFCLLFAKYIFFICSLVTCLCIHIDNECLINSVYLCACLFLPSDNLYFLTGVFSPVIFNVITDMIGIGPKVLFFYFLYISVFPSSLPLSSPVFRVFEYVFIILFYFFYCIYLFYYF